ncbi:sodium- and chloride-dependent GABA transporter ine-like [Engraulis encrasicolus]|uniref:sodium- and chloride-dependent GABA transporter ine-like n=1 Tax=Engraulis encrasicolus TaxID=184585 RepID=UPI002FD0DF49
MDLSGASKPAPGQQQRDSWERPSHFILTALGYAVNVGTFVIYPTMFFYGGGADYFIPYLITMVLFTMPMVYLEFSIGQLTQRGPVQAFTQLCPLLKGVGVCMVVVSLLVNGYFNVMMSWILFYLFSSLSPSLPYLTNDNAWNTPGNTPRAVDVDMDMDMWDLGGDLYNFTNITRLDRATRDFFNVRVLGISDGIEQMGSVRWELLGCLVLTLIIEYLCIFKGVKLSGKVVYVTTLLPYAVLFLLLMVTLSLEGIGEGLSNAFGPSWYRLGSFEVWTRAVSQATYSFGMGTGVLISMGSYNKHNYNNICRDSVIVTLVHFASVLLTALVVLGGIGHLNWLQNSDWNDNIHGGFEQPFKEYTLILAAMPVPQLWAVLFFIMLLNMELGRLFSHLELVGSCVLETLGPKLPPGLRRKEILLVPVCVASFLVGLPCVFQGGIYVVVLMDLYISIPMMMLPLLEIVGVCWMLGPTRLFDMFSKSLGKAPNIFFKVCWMGITPLIAVLTLAGNLAMHHPPMYYGFQYPYWCAVVGFLLIVFTLMWIPIGYLRELWSPSRPHVPIHNPTAAEDDDRVEMEEVR